MTDRRDFPRTGHTIGGREIYLDRTDAQNHARRAAMLTQVALIGAVDHGHGPDQWEKRQAHLMQVADRLMANLRNGVHYGDNGPGSYFSDGTPTVADPEFTFFDLWSFGVTGPDGWPGFSRDCDMPPQTTEADAIAATGFLLVDESIRLLDAGQEFKAAAAIYEASECAGMLRAMAWESEGTDAGKAIREYLCTRGQAAGKASGEVRRRQARANPDVVVAAYGKMMATGEHSEAEAKRGLAERFNVTVDAIRLILRKHSGNAE